MDAARPARARDVEPMGELANESKEESWCEISLKQGRRS